MFAVVCVMLAAAGHSLMSEQSVPLWVIVGALVGVFGAVWPLTARERDVVSVTAVSVAAQAVLHVALTISQAITATQPPATDHAHHGSMPEMTMSAGHAMDANSMFGMFAAHLLAALLCGLWLAYGERAAFRILRTAVRRVRRAILLFGSPITVTRQRPGRTGQTEPGQLTRLLLLVHSLISRGPPGRTAVS